MILLDSSVLIELFRKKNKQDTLFYKLSQSEQAFSISTITYYESGIGNRKSHTDYWDKLCEKLMVIPFDKACADNAVSIYLDLMHKNKLIDLADLFIGATAVTHNIPIATLNVKHFERIDNLETIQ
jgi:predicted nucleic acid-binding protein